MQNDININPSDLELVERDEAIVDVEFSTESVSYLKDVWRRFRRDRVTMVAAGMVILVILMGIIGPQFSDFTHTEQNVNLQYLPPRIPGLEGLNLFNGSRVLTLQSTTLPRYEETGAIMEYIDSFDQPVRGGSVEMVVVRVDMYRYLGADDVYYWFGSDALGRDLFTRLWTATGTSLRLAFLVSFINLTIGLIIGSICGYYGGWIDLIVERIKEVIWAIPSIPLIIMLILLFGASFGTLMFVFCLTGWMGISSGVRIQFYRYKGREYVLASRTMGANDFRLMYKHILPNAAGTLITQMVLTVPFVVFQEAGLSYLGLGLQPPDTSIGLLLMEGQRNLLEYPYFITFPAIVIVLLMLAFNLFGNGLRDAFNPSLRQ